jgi:hypothetical protein
MSLDTKRCAACNEIKSHSAFHANAKNKTDGLQNRCKLCANHSAKAFRDKWKNPFNPFCNQLCSQFLKQPIMREMDYELV